jgi:hypothetical protein
MPSAIIKLKARKPFTRQGRKLRRSSTQASPASSSSITHVKDGTAPPRPISSNDVLPACTGTLRAQEPVENLQERAAQVIHINRPRDSGAKDNIQR